MDNNTQLVHSKRTFNIYCDESCYIQHDRKSFLLLGAISVSYPQVKLHSKNIREAMEHHHFKDEIKWNTVSKSKIRFYEELLDIFFSTDIRFRVIIVPKADLVHIPLLKYEDVFYKMYYRLLNQKINTEYTYNVYLDIKDTYSSNKVRKLKDVLNVEYGVFRNVQNINSKESVLMQMCDFIMGSFAYMVNDRDQSNEAKVALVKKIQKHLGESEKAILKEHNFVNPLIIEMR